MVGRGGYGGALGLRGGAGLGCGEENLRNLEGKLSNLEAKLRNLEEKLRDLEENLRNFSWPPHIFFAPHREPHHIFFAPHHMVGLKKNSHA